MSRPGLGIPVDLLTETTIGLVGDGLQDMERNTFSKIDLLDLITLGEEETGTVTFLFEPTEDLTSLGFVFEAATALDVSALGGTAQNQDFLTFSNLSVAAVPEPSTSLLATVASCFLLGTRRRR